jgi:hypothetical protein
MARTQVQLTEHQIEALQQLSAVTGLSIADLIRQGIDQYLAKQRGLDPKDRIERAIRVAGRFSSGMTDVSANHDKHLADAIKR